jgi:hypothetical protein
MEDFCEERCVRENTTPDEILRENAGKQRVGGQDENNRKQVAALDDGDKISHLVNPPLLWEANSKTIHNLRVGVTVGVAPVNSPRFASLLFVIVLQPDGRIATGCRR